MDSLHLLQNVTPDVPFCPARAGRMSNGADPNECHVRPLRGKWELLNATERVRACHSELLTL